MKKLATLAFAALILTACKENTTTKEETMGTETPEKTTTQSSDWVTLFDGTNFDQWRGYGTQEMYSEWSIDGNAMKFTPGKDCLLYTSPSPRDQRGSRMPSSA